jgi:hypothetical protein
MLFWVTARDDASYSIQCELGVRLDRLRAYGRLGFVVDVTVGEIAFLLL